MSSHKNRLIKLETTTAPRLSLAELAKRINRVLQNPQLLQPAAYARMMQIIGDCERRKAGNEQP